MLSMLKPNIQLFADADPAQADGAQAEANLGANAGADTQNQGENQGEQTADKTYTQADVDKMVQAETDRRVQQAIDSFKKKELPGLIEGAKTEAEKLAKMTADQKADHQKKQQEEALARREQEITRRELRANALETLAERGRPKSLADILDYSSAEACAKSIDTVDAAFQAAVEQAVNDRLKGSTPKGGKPLTPQSLKEKYSEAMKAGNTVQAVEIKRKAFEAGQIIN